MISENTLTMEGRFKVVVIMLVAVSALVQTSAAQKRYVVGGASGWTIPAAGSAAYTNWATGKTFKNGDTLVFNFPTGLHNVAEVTKADYDACTASNPISLVSNGPASITLNKTGVHYYICAVGNHCSFGQKLTVTVNSASAPAPPPKNAPAAAPALAPGLTSAPVPASAPAPAPSRGSVTYTVGDKLGWTIPSSENAYLTWASGKTFFVGDILVFNFPNAAHNVAEVTKANYDSCGTKSTVSLFTNPPVRVTLSKPGEHFFICTFPGHCAAAQKLSINVTASNSASSPSPLAPSSSTTTRSVAPSPSPTSTSPSTPSPAGTTSTTPSSPSPAVATTPGNSAESARVAGLGATLLTLAVAFFC